jgi:hypothetical protein
MEEMHRVMAYVSGTAPLVFYATIHASPAPALYLCPYICTISLNSKRERRKLKGLPVQPPPRSESKWKFRLDIWCRCRWLPLIQFLSLSVSVFWATRPNLLLPHHPISAQYRKEWVAGRQRLRVSFSIRTRSLDSSLRSEIIELCYELSPIPHHSHLSRTHGKYEPYHYSLSSQDQRQQRHTHLISIPF